MKKMIRQDINAASDTDAGNEKLSAAIDGLKDDFDYFISGLEKLDRTGAEASSQALIIAERLSSSLQENIAEISSAIGG